MKIGPYSVLRQIAKGGMGEVLLVFDPICERTIALKRIRHDLKERGHYKARFLQEAKLTSQLTHPGIISIYSIHADVDDPYYTMPYVEGKTLKQLLKSDDNSIHTLLPIFKSACQTLAYTHAKGILHRDLKPENILVGHFGEVLILDWGLARHVEDLSEQENETVEERFQTELTMPGKLVGTLAFMAPERALRAPTTIQTEIYALGVILYLILTLKLPFQRPSLKEFKEKQIPEPFVEPEELAPYRNVPAPLSRIAKRCLAHSAAARYNSVDALLHDLTSYMEGRSEWFEAGTLCLTTKSDWEFQENVMLAKHTAIATVGEWVALSIAKSSFGHPLKLKTRITLGPKCHGIGFLFNIPENSARESPFDGDCLWLGRIDSALFRNGIKIMQLLDITLDQTSYEITIEKIDSGLRLYLNEQLRFTYVSHLPHRGNYVGVLSKDADFTLELMRFFVGGGQLEVSCLAIPDAFLASDDLPRALDEYRRIATAFSSHLEGLQALFRAGITRLEQAKKHRSKVVFADALEEFSKLHTTAAAPLEYLGKSLVYQALEDRDEEVKCLELALRRYKDHPLIGPLQEQILYRMHECASTDRVAAYQLVLVSLRHLPNIVDNSEAMHLFTHLLNHAQKPYFLENRARPSELKTAHGKIAFSIELAYAAALPNVLVELFENQLKEKEPSHIILNDILWALKELGVRAKAEELQSLLPPESPTSFRRWRQTIFQIEALLFRQKKPQDVEPLAATLDGLDLQKNEQELLDSFRLWSLLLRQENEKAEEFLNRYSHRLDDEESPFFGLWGSFLGQTDQQRALTLFGKAADRLFPPTTALIAHALTRNLLMHSKWLKTAFLFEKRTLYRQLSLYAFLQQDLPLYEHYQRKESEQYLDL